MVKQASWGATRDNLVLGSEGNGIDGAHILTPMPYLISAGKVTQNNVPTPMYILARLNLNGQCISVAKEYEDLKVGLDTVPFKAGAGEEESVRQGDQGRESRSRAARTICGSATGSPPAASTPTRTSRPSRCRRRRWWRT